MRFSEDLHARDVLTSTSPYYIGVRTLSLSSCVVPVVARGLEFRNPRIVGSG
jgi:hypothetical protein